MHQLNPFTSSLGLYVPLDAVSNLVNKGNSLAIVTNPSYVEPAEIIREIRNQMESNGDLGPSYAVISDTAAPVDKQHHCTKSRARMNLIRDTIEKHSVILVTLPETYMHPAEQDDLREYIQGHLDGKLVILETNSPEIIGERWDLVVELGHCVPEEHMEPWKKLAAELDAGWASGTR